MEICIVLILMTWVGILFQKILIINLKILFDLMLNINFFNINIINITTKWHIVWKYSGKTLQNITMSFTNTWLNSCIMDQFPQLSF